MAEIAIVPAGEGGRGHLESPAERLMRYSRPGTLALATLPPLSLYIHDTLPLMDLEAPDYALVVLTLVESILENPELIIYRVVPERVL